MLTLILKGDHRFGIEHKDLPSLARFYYILLHFIRKFPPNLPRSEIIRLSDPNLYQERLKVFRNPEAFVKDFANSIRRHVININTEIIDKGYHCYNNNTFSEYKTCRTAFKLNRGQRNDLELTLIKLAILNY